MSFFAAICWMALGAVIGVLIFMVLFACGVIQVDDAAWKDFLQRLENLRKNHNLNIE